MTEKEKLRIGETGRKKVRKGKKGHNPPPRDSIRPSPPPPPPPKKKKGSQE